MVAQLTIGALIATLLLSSAINIADTNTKSETAKNKREMLIATSETKEFKVLEKAKNLYYKIYTVKPTSNQDLIDKKLLRENFNNSKNSRNLYIQPDGTITSTSKNHKTNKMLISKSKNIQASSNKTNSTTTKSIKERNNQIKYIEKTEFESTNSKTTTKIVEHNKKLKIGETKIIDSFDNFEVNNKRNTQMNNDKYSNNFEINHEYNNYREKPMTQNKNDFEYNFEETTKKPISNNNDINNQQKEIEYSNSIDKNFFN